MIKEFLVLLFFIAALPAALAFSTECPDAKNDGVISVLDLVRIVKAINENDLAFDITDDGAINIMDLRAVADKIGTSCIACAQGFVLDNASGKCILDSPENCGPNGAICNYKQSCIVDYSGVAACQKSISDIAREKCIKVGAIMQYHLMVPGSYADSESARIYRKRMNNFATIITPENELKWGSVQPYNKDSFDFTAADAIMNFAYDNNIEVKVHAPIWYSQNPLWVNGLNCEQLKDAYRTYVTTVLNRYKGKIQYWDLVNEPIGHDFVYQDKCGYSGFLGFAAEISKLIKASDPGIILIVNEYGVEDPYNEKIVSLNNWINDLTANYGAIVDQIGFQYHFKNSFTASYEGGHLSWWAANTGKKIAITELDAGSDSFSGCASRPDWGYQEGCQANYYGSIAEFAFANRSVSYLNFWTFWDKSSWVVNAGFYRNDATASQKPSLNVIWQKINNAPSRCA